MTIYLFTGLGADYRAYSKMNFEGYKVSHVQWLTPDINESIVSYAKRLLFQITDKESVFIGLSFGGIMAIEVSKYIKPLKIILISSVKNHKEIPFYLRIMGSLKLYKLISDKELTSTNFIMNYFFGIKREKDKKLLHDIVKDTDPNFVKWAIRKTVTWNNEMEFNNLIHIHGNKDKIFPIRYVKANKIVKKGGHFMIVDKAEEIGSYIRSII